MGNLLPSLGRRKLPMLDMPRVGGKAGGSDVPVSGTLFSAVDLGPSFVECGGQYTPVPPPAFPLAVKSKGFAGMSQRPDPLNNPRSMFWYVHYTGTQFVVFGQDDGGYGVQWTSPDLKTFTWRGYWYNRSDVSQFGKHAVSVGNLITAVGHGINYSPDAGLTWYTPANGFPGDIVKIAYGNGIWVAVGQYFTYTSTDGINFTRRTIMQDGAFRDVVYGKGLFIAVGSNSNGPTIYASPDGVTWRLQNAQGTQPWVGVGYRPSVGEFLAISASGTPAISTDGLNWGLLSQFTTVQSNISGVLAAPDYWSVIDIFGNVYVRVGTSWTTYAAEPAYVGSYSVRSAGGTYVGNGQFVVSGQTVNNIGWGWWARYAVGDNLFKMPDIPAAQNKTGTNLKAYMRIAP